MTSYKTFYANGQAQQVWTARAAKDVSTILVVNNDLSKSASFSSARMSSVSESQVVPVPPLGTMSFSANRDLWAISAGSSVQCFIVPDGQSWSPSPVQIAQQNALAGIGTSVPQLLRATDIISANTSFGPFTISFPFGGSYEIVCDNLGINSQVADITIKHIASDGLTTVYTENYTVAVGIIGNSNPVILRGNVQGASIQVTGLTCTSAYMNALGLITGPFTAGNLNLTYFGTSLQVAEARPKMAPSNVQGGIIQEIEGIALAAGGTQGPVQMPSYAGRAIASVFSVGTLARMTIQGFRVNTGATPQFTLRLVQVTAGSSSVNEIVVPQFFCTMSEVNGDTVGRTPAIQLMEADYV